MSPRTRRTSGRRDNPSYTTGVAMCSLLVLLVVFSTCRNGHLAALPHRIGLRETESQSSLVAPPSRAWEVYRPFRRATFGQTSLRHLRGGEFEGDVPGLKEDKEEVSLDVARSRLETAVNRQATEQILHCCAEFLAPDTQRVKAAENFAKEAFKDAQAINSLVYIISTSPDKNIRQLSAVFLRKLISAHWDVILSGRTQVDGPTIKGMLLGLLVQEPDGNVKRAIAAAVATLNKRTHWRGKWTALEELVFKGVSSPEPHIRQSCMQLLVFMSDEIGIWLMDKDTYGDRMLGIFERGLKDDDKRVVVMTLKAFSSLCARLGGDDEMMTFSSLIPTLLSSLTVAYKAGHQDIVVEVLEILDELAPSKTGILSKNIEIVLGNLLAIIQLPDVADDVADAAMGVIATMLKFKTKELIATQRMQEVLHIALKAMVRSIEIDPEDGENSAGADLLHEMAVQISSCEVFNPAATLAVQMMNDASSTPQVRASGVLALGVMAEGCRDVMRPHVQGMLAQVRKTLQDPAPLVKRYALVALSRFAHDLGEFFLKQHLPSLTEDLYPILKHESDALACPAADVITRMGMNSDPEILLPILPPLLMHLLAAAKTAASQGKSKRAARFITAVGSLAEGSEAEFVSFLPGTMEVLSELWAVDKPSEVRASALEAVGSVAKAVDKGPFGPYVSAAINTASNALQKESGSDSEVQTSAIYLLSNIADILKSEMVSYVETFAGAVVSVLKDTRSTETTYKRDSSVPTGPDLSFDISKRRGQDLESDEDDEEDSQKSDLSADEEKLEETEEITDDDVGVRTIVSVRTGECEKLSAAISLVDTLCAYAAVGIESYLKDIFGITVAKLTDNHDPTVRAAGVKSIGNIITAAVKLSEFYADEGEKRTSQRWEAWASENVEEMSQELLWQATHENMIKVAEACVLTFETLVDLSTSPDHPKLMSKAMVDEAHKLVKRVLKGRTMAQGGGEPPDAALLLQEATGTFKKDQEDEEKTEYAAGSKLELPLLEAAIDLMSAVARKKGVKFDRKFKRLAPLLENLLTNAEEIESRALGARGFAEAFLSLGAAAQPYVISLRPVLTRILTDLREKATQPAAPSPGSSGGTTSVSLSNGELRLQWSATWCLGVLCSACPQDMSVHYSQLLTLIMPQLQTEPESHASKDEMTARDNAVFALARMIRAKPESIPMESILPQLLDKLPPLHDKSETEVTTDMLVALWKKQEKTFLSMLQKVLGSSARILRATLIPGEDRLDLDDSARQDLLKMVGEICARAQASGQAGILLSGLPEQEKQTLNQALASLSGPASQ